MKKSLQERVELLRNQPIDQRFPYLYLDARFLDARWARTVENVSALVAYGVGEDGHRHLLSITIGASESQDSWAELLRQLLDRGLSGVQLVIADGHAGLAAAARQALPEAKLQRLHCSPHAQHPRQSALAAPQPTRQGDLGHIRGHVAQGSQGPPGDAQGRSRHPGPRSNGMSRRRFCPSTTPPLHITAAATQFFSFPKSHWRRLRSTNGLERLHGEVKRRINSVGDFPDRASALRLITAVAIDVTDIWDDRRYLDMSLLNSIEAKAAA